MIKNWKLKNFKSVSDDSILDFKPLTIFAGANSSGKSTLIHSILVTTQTVRNSEQAKPIVLNGTIIKLGDFRDVVHNGEINREIVIAFNLDLTKAGTESNEYLFEQIKGKYESVFCECTFGVNTNEFVEKDMRFLQPLLNKLEMKVITKEAVESTILIKKTEGNVDVKKKGIESEELHRTNVIASLQYDVLEPTTYQFSNSYSQDPLEGDYVGVMMMHFLPYYFTVKYEVNKNEALRLVTSLIERDHIFSLDKNASYPKPLINKLLDIAKKYEKKVSKAGKKSLEHVFKESRADMLKLLTQKFNLEGWRDYFYHMRSPEFEGMLRKNKAMLTDLAKGDEEKYKFAVIDTPGDFDRLTHFILNFYRTKINYLGPLRDEPKPIYPLSTGLDTKDVGLKGEFTAAVLNIHKHTLISFFSPNKTSRTINTLQIAVQEWLEHMGVASAMESKDKGKLGHELQIQTKHGDSFHDLTNVGVGVSQVLPILVQALLAPSDSTLIFEQPELHLHPRVQSRLADFFVSMIALGKQCIVETHSEYLINRLRYLTAVSKTDIASSVAIYFVENEGGKSTYNKIQMNDYGTLNDWPKGFFDESEINSSMIIKAAIDKNKRKKSD